MYATKDYLDKFGTPKLIKDLDTHQCIQFIMPNSGRALPWSFQENKKLIEWVPNNPVLISGDVVGAIRFSNANGGVFQCYDFIAKHAENSNLVEIMHDFKGSSRPFHLLYPYSKYLPNKIRVFIDFVENEMKP